MAGAKVRTSKSHPLRLDWLDPPARVGMTLLPGVIDSSSEGFRWERDLATDLAALRAAGTTALVCLLEDHEFARYGVPDFVAKVQAAGLELLRLAIPDTRIPHDLAAVDPLLDAIDAHEASGGKLVIHCRGGLGRTGTIAGCYLVRRGQSPAQALATLHRVRKTPRCPENPLQEQFIARYAERRAASPPAPPPTVPAAASPPAAAPRAPTASPVPAPAPAWYATALTSLATVERAATAPSSKSAVATLLADLEDAVAAAPATCFSFAPSGAATLTAAGRSFAAGTFTTPSLGELRTRLAAHPHNARGRLVLSILHCAHPLTDIGTLQATAPPGTLFQVASQFNCLEAPGPHIVPVRDYLHDHTQGPRASVSAFPATLLRHYRAPAADGTRFVQTDDHCLNLLADAVPAEIAEVHSGYLQTSQVHDMKGLASALETSFDKLRVGVHAGVEVVFGHDWSGPVSEPGRTIAQVFTSTIALGGYGKDDGSAAIAVVRRQLLRAAYLGTLLAALDLGCDTVVLTMIGGGVFGNPVADIWSAIHWAVAEAEAFAGGGGGVKQVLVNTRETVAEADRAKVRAGGGVFVEFGGPKIEVLR